MTATMLADGGATRFAAEIRAASGEPLSGHLGWAIRDWEGNELGAGSREVSVPALGQPASVDVPAPAFRKELIFAEAEFRLEIPGQVAPKVQAYWLATPPPHPDTALRPESPFGMGVYLGRFRGADQDKVAQLARDIGVKWSREGFNWGRIERQPGHFDWWFYDRLVETARANGITIYGLVSDFAAWSRGYTSEGVDQYTAFLRQLVGRYKDRIKQWEVWNEPNIFFWQGPKELYAECLIKSYQAIKETDPTAEVLGISTAGIDFKFIEQMLAKGTPFDVLTIHPYRRTMDDAAFIADLKKVSDLVKWPDGKSRPVWLTEMGWATHVPHQALGQDFEPNSQRAQAEYLARTYLCSIVSGVEPRTFWYDFRNDGDDPVYFEHNMGIVTRDLRPKPACLAFATLTRLLRGMRFAGPVAFQVPTNVFAYRFEPDLKASGVGRAGFAEVLALWSPRQDVSIKVPATAPSLELVNTIGEGQRIAASEEGVEVRLAAGKPVYLARPAAAPPGKESEVMEGTRTALPPRWWESVASITRTRLRSRGGQPGLPIKDQVKLSAMLDDMRAQGIASLEIFAPAHGGNSFGGLDTIDRYRIDPAFGDMNDFRRLVRMAHSKDMPIITFDNLGYCSADAPTWLKACDDVRAGKDSKEAHWFLWSDDTNAPAPPHDSIYMIGGKPNAGNWYFSARAGRYYWSKWGGVDLAGNKVHLPQYNWGTREWQEEAEKIIRFWMGTGIDGMIIDAVNWYVNYDWEMGRRRIIDVINSYGNAYSQPEGGGGFHEDPVTWITEGGWNSIQDYGLGIWWEKDTDVLQNALKTGDPRPIEKALRNYHDRVVAAGGVLYFGADSRGQSEDPEQRRLAAAVRALSGILVAVSYRGETNRQDPEIVRLLELKRVHPALYNVSTRRHIPTAADDKHYAFLRTAKDGSERILVVMNFQSTPQTVAVDMSGLATAGLVDLRENTTTPRQNPFKVELPAYGYRIYLVRAPENE
jgi:hypothetical protein